MVTVAVIVRILDIVRYWCLLYELFFLIKTPRWVENSNGKVKFLVFTVVFVYNLSFTVVCYHFRCNCSPENPEVRSFNTTSGILRRKSDRMVFFTPTVDNATPHPCSCEDRPNHSPSHPPPYTNPPYLVTLKTGGHFGSWFFRSPPGVVSRHDNHAQDGERHTPLLGSLWFLLRNRFYGNGWMTTKMTSPFMTMIPLFAGSPLPPGIELFSSCSCRIYRSAHQIPYTIHLSAIIRVVWWSHSAPPTVMVFSGNTPCSTQSVHIYSL